RGAAEPVQRTMYSTAWRSRGPADNPSRPAPTERLIVWTLLEAGLRTSERFHVTLSGPMQRSIRRSHLSHSGKGGKRSSLLKVTTTVARVATVVVNWEEREADDGSQETVAPFVGGADRDHERDLGARRRDGG